MVSSNLVVWNTYTHTHICMHTHACMCVKEHKRGILVETLQDENSKMGKTCVLFFACGVSIAHSFKCWEMVLRVMLYRGVGTFKRWSLLGNTWGCCSQKEWCSSRGIYVGSYERVLQKDKPGPASFTHFLSPYLISLFCMISCLDANHHGMMQPGDLHWSQHHVVWTFSFWNCKLISFLCKLPSFRYSFMTMERD